MSEPRTAVSLAGLQKILDRLDVGEELTLGIGDYRRLFGLNDIARGRVDNFARGHGCRAEASASAIVFRKLRRLPR